MGQSTKNRVFSVNPVISPSPPRSMLEKYCHRVQSTLKRGGGGGILQLIYLVFCRFSNTCGTVSSFTNPFSMNSSSVPYIFDQDCLTEEKNL